MKEQQCILPVFNRMREYHLYTSHGERFLDMFQDSGRAILGHRPKGLSNTLKMVLAKGHQASYPSVYTPRLKKLLVRLLPEYPHTALFSSPGEMKEYCGRYGKEEPWAWRAWSEMEIPESFPVSVCPVIPHPGSTLSALCSRQPLPEESTQVSALQTAGAVHILHTLLEEHESPREIPSLFEEQKLWNREGIYLYPDYPREKHSEIFQIFLTHKVVISPEYSTPSVIPAILSEYEKKILTETLKEIAL